MLQTNPGMYIKNKQFIQKNGFTIVELLIVIVVIAILAAITIVAYNGIQNRAKASSAQAAVKQAATKVRADSVQNSDRYPVSLSSVSINNSDSISYQYTVNNNANPGTFCITATASGLSYFLSSVATSPARGACPGHGADGQIIAVNNYRNPQFNGPLVPVAVSGVSSVTLASYQGSQMARVVASSVNEAQVAADPTNEGYYTPPRTLIYGQVKICNGANAPRDFIIFTSFAALDGNGGASSSRPRTIAANQCVVVSPVDTSPNFATYATYWAWREPGSGAAVGDVFYLDNIYIGEVSSAFADGTTSGWMWLGDANNSASAGPPAV